MSDDLTQPMTRADRLYAAFQAFDKENPHVFQEIVKITNQVRERRAHWGMQALFERLRWISEFQTLGDPFKMNNNHGPFYVRKLEAVYPELKGFYFKRRAIADAVYS